jgi:RimJ/RimL family protein N-acetyltransferase
MLEGHSSLKPPALRTDRLLLRRWTKHDRDAFAEINADPEVSRYRFAPLTREQSDELIDEIERSFDERGFGLWAVERIEDYRLLGFIGLEVTDIAAPHCPAVAIGWQLTPDAWGHGYATEGATASLDFAFDVLRLPEVVADTTSINERSRAVMGRLGMTHDPADDFDGPWYPPGHPQRRFVLYRMSEHDWRNARHRQTRSARLGERGPALVTREPSTHFLRLRS